MSNDLCIVLFALIIIRPKHVNQSWNAKTKHGKDLKISLKWLKSSKVLDVFYYKHRISGMNFERRNTSFKN